MSASPAVVTEAHLDYVAERTRGDDAFLVELKEAALEADIPEIWVSPAQASFMQILLKLSRAREVIEVGTLAGYSAIQMARALPPGGRVRTIELEKKHADFAEAWIARSDVADRIEVHRGAGAEVLARFAADSADASFIDADKANYPTYLRESLRVVRRGGLVMADNAFAFGQLLDEHPTDSGVEAIRRFNDLVAGVRELHAVIAPVGDGLWVGVRE